MISHPFKTIQILGIPLCCADYSSAYGFLKEAARSQSPVGATASASHLVTVARHDPGFRTILQQLDAIFPDGMPLVRLMNWQGAGLRDRVYGPYLMRHIIQNTSAPFRHYFFGGTEECLNALIPALRKIQPDLEIAGFFSPPFRQWTESDLEAFASRIRDSNPDFIWVALGGERQERWIVENRHRFKRGVFIGVGDAFELLAGRRTFAPAWMQRCSLTWLYRLIQEPLRLWKRYFVYNSLFLWYLFWDSLKAKFKSSKP